MFCLTDTSSWSTSDFSDDISSDFDIPAHPFARSGTSQTSGLRRVRAFQSLDVATTDKQPSELACTSKQLSLPPVASSGHRVITPMPGTSSNLSRAASYQSNETR